MMMQTEVSEVFGPFSHSAQAARTRLKGYGLTHL
jgi:hypothetical protein